MKKRQQHANGSSKRFQYGPVKWLLGRQLISGLRWIAIYTFYGEKLDARDWMNAHEEDLSKKQFISKDEKGEPCFWFDYIADTGDDNKATYTIACLCLSDLYLSSKQAEPGSLVNRSGAGYLLPRGEFLFVGGDTAYHIADFATLTDRFQEPFNWASDDIYGSDTVLPKKPIFAIPGNHDYYDALDGFNRQFCKPIYPDSPCLHLNAFERKQCTSYVALKLPFDWRFWGLDAQEGKIDFRQQHFYRNISPKDEAGNPVPPKKLIVATPGPSTRFGQLAKADSEIVKTFKKIGLEPFFIQNPVDLPDKDGCRLDISGDIHHYERYWGEGVNQDNDPKLLCENYASVIAGGGGAFLHASHTDVGQLQSNQVYPERAASHNIMTRNLLWFWKIVQGGHIWLAGGLIVMALYFALTIPDSTWSLLSSSSEGDAAFIPQSIRPCGNTMQLCETSLLGKVQQALSIEEIETYPYQLYVPDILFAFLLFALLLYFTIRLKKNHQQIIESSLKDWRKYSLYFVGTVMTVVLVIKITELLVILYIKADLPYPFISSTLAFLYLMNSIALLVYTRQLANLMIDRKKYCVRNSMYISRLEQNAPIWFFIIIAAINVGIGFWYYGTNLAAVALTDTATIAIVVLPFFGLVLLAVLVGGALEERPRRFWLLIGLWHAIVQFSVGLIMAIYSSYLEMLVITVSIIGISYLIPRVPMLHCQAKENFSRAEQSKIAGRLFIYWIGLGLLAFFAVIYISGMRPEAITLDRIFMVFVLGAVLGCLWFGWYLAVSLAFNGHNNEAGGGACSPRYRHMIRFKLTENQLTGYVIGFNQPIDKITKDTQFELIDVFRVNSIGKKV